MLVLFQIISGIIKKILLKYPKASIEIVKWKDAKSIWRKRAAAVSFVKIAKTGNYTDQIIKICSTILRSDERFVQLGAGWVLKEAWLGNKKKIEEYLKKNKQRLSREALRYAIEKMPEKKRKFYLK